MADNIILNGAELKKHLKLAKARPLAFAYAYGPSEDEDSFAIDRKKKPDTLGKALNAASIGTKYAHGMVTVEGKDMVLTLHRELPGLAKRVKKHLRQHKAPLNVRIVSADGATVENDIEELPDTPETDTDLGNDGAAPDLSAVHARAAALKSAVAALDPEPKDRLLPAFKKGAAALNVGNADGATKLFDQIDAALAKLARAPAAAPSANMEALSKAQDALRAKADALPNSPQRAAILKALDTLKDQIGAGDAASAAKSVKQLKAALSKMDGAAGGGSNEAAFKAARASLLPNVTTALKEGTPDPRMVKLWKAFEAQGKAGKFAEALKLSSALEKLVPAGKAGSAGADVFKLMSAARKIWTGARKTMSVEMKTLEGAILAACQDLDMPDLSGKIKGLQRHLSSLDSGLDAALAAIASEQDSAKRKPLVGAAEAQVAQVKSRLDTDFFRDLDGGNGFKPVNVRGEAMSALGRVEAALARAA